MFADHRTGNDALKKKIVERIKNSAEQSIPFHDFMECCLYDPDDGYYTNERTKIGKKGDFYTSSSIGTVFGEVLARYFSAAVKAKFTLSEPVQLVEWGGGTGRLAKHILDELRRSAPRIYEAVRHISVEASPALQTEQRENLAEHAAKVRFVRTEEWPSVKQRRNTLIYANELLDAFPVHRVTVQNGALCEVCVGWSDRTAAFYEILRPLSPGPVMDYLQSYGIRLKEGQQAEVNLHAERWIQRLGKWLEHGIVVVIDYGDLAEEIYGEHRMKGTLMCYYRHSAHDNPYIRPGMQDMTAHVNFTSVLAAAQAAGFTVRSFQTQKQFLADNGIFNLLQNHDAVDPFHPAARKNRAIRQLLLSDHMSETFKVLVLEK
jgi:SAM-dependent MidA family methyltransferase